MINQQSGDQWKLEEVAKSDDHDASKGATIGVQCRELRRNEAQELAGYHRYLIQQYDLNSPQFIHFVLRAMDGGDERSRFAAPTVCCYR